MSRQRRFQGWALPDIGVSPIREYHRDIGKSLTGGVVYPGKQTPDIVGAFLNADFISTKMWTLRYDSKQGRVGENHPIKSNNLAAMPFGEDEAGEVYRAGRRPDRPPQPPHRQINSEIRKNSDRVCQRLHRRPDHYSRCSLPVRIVSQSSATSNEFPLFRGTNLDDGYPVAPNCDTPQVHGVTMASRKTIYTDAEVQALLAERKELPQNWRTRLKLIPREGTSFLHRQWPFTGDNGHEFRVFLRKNEVLAEDFSIGLILLDSEGELILTRYNGSSHRHTNHIEKRKGDPDHTFRDQCHIHLATERYQRSGRNDDGFAKVTTEYSTFETAFEAFFDSNGFSPSASDDGGQMTLDFESHQ